MNKCDTCDGTGLNHLLGECTECSGTGTVYHQNACTVCGGTGNIDCEPSGANMLLANNIRRLNEKLDEVKKVLALVLSEKTPDELDKFKSNINNLPIDILDEYDTVTSSEKITKNIVKDIIE